LRKLLRELVLHVDRVGLWGEGVEVDFEDVNVSDRSPVKEDEFECMGDGFY